MSYEQQPQPQDDAAAAAALWEAHHEFVGNTLFSLGTEIAQFIVDYYHYNSKYREYAKILKKEIYNEWAINQGMLQITFEWADESKNDITMILRNLLGTPQLDMIDGWCPQLLQDALLRSEVAQRFVQLDEDYGAFVLQNEAI
jgi:hypothetical protein